jgi:hypothetical protein
LGKVFDVEIAAESGTVRGVLYRVEGARGALLMVGGAGGGLHGPAGIYEQLSLRLQRDGVAALRLEYRLPNNLRECVHDVVAGIEALKGEGIERVALLGWSFGGAVVIDAGAQSEKVVGVATVASQTYGADAVSELSPKSLLLIHGTADAVLPDRCSRDLYRNARQPKELLLYEGDNHGITNHVAEMLSKLHQWSLDLLKEKREDQPERERDSRKKDGQATKEIR